MRTTLNLDSKALADALLVMPGKTKTEVVNEALRQLARKQAYAGLLALEGTGWEGDLEALRKRSPRARL
jgi:Arc/MetJ family transcription regulator